VIKIGDYNELVVVRKSKDGYFLDADTGNEDDDILIPFENCLGEHLDIWQKLNVFVYNDSRGKLYATLNKPLATVGEFAYLTVKSNVRRGSFVDLGIGRTDIFAPEDEQICELQEGNKYLFYIYLDSRNNIAATTNVEGYLEFADEDTYKIGDEVFGVVCQFYNSENVCIAVENKYKGIMLKNEFFEEINLEDILKLKIKKIYEDGTLGVTTRITGKQERTKLQEDILKYLKQHDGFMPYNDKSSPEDIKAVFRESKNYFKKALGGLMKKGLIKQDEKGTTLIKNISKR